MRRCSSRNIYRRARRGRRENLQGSSPSSEFHDLRCQLNWSCHPERSKMFRLRNISRSRRTSINESGPVRLGLLRFNRSEDSLEDRGPSTAGLRSQVNASPALRMTRDDPWRRRQHQPSFAVPATPPLRSCRTSRKLITAERSKMFRLRNISRGRRTSINESGPVRLGLLRFNRSEDSLEDRSPSTAGLRSQVNASPALRMTRDDP